MTRPTSTRLDRIEAIVTDRKKREQADRSRNAHTRAASATRAEIDAICGKICTMPGHERAAYLKTVDDYVLLVMRDHLEKYTTRMAAAMPAAEIAALVQRTTKMDGMNADAFFETLTDIELQVLLNIKPDDSDDSDGICWDMVPEIALDAFLDGEITFNELLERYPKQEETKQ